jgi:hypothetical protein
MLALIAAALMTVSHGAGVPHPQLHEVARVERSETRELQFTSASPRISLRSSIRATEATSTTVSSALAQYCVPEHTDADRIFCHD